MKSIALVLISLIVSSFAGAQTSLDKELRTIAADHLKDLHINSQNLELRQDTKFNQLYVATYTGGTLEFPCHTGVVVNKSSKSISMGTQDPELIVHFPYTDTFPNEAQKIYEFCAD